MRRTRLRVPVRLLLPVRLRVRLLLPVRVPVLVLGLGVGDGDPGAIAETEAAATPAPVRVDEDVPVGLLAGRYELERRLGAGGMGVVYAARDHHLGRAVAIKLVRARADSREAQDRLALEARAMAKLRHPNVATLFDIGMVGDRVFIVMELVDGGTLTAWLARAPRPWREVLGFFLQAARGLAAAHAAGFVHRDFKADNVLVGSDGVVRVSDFGVVRMIGEVGPGVDSSAGDGPTTKGGTVAGTPGYIAPEILHRQPVDERADQFSFCVALHVALNGTRPFASTAAEPPTVTETLGPLREAPRGKAPRWLGRILTRGLAADPAGRWPSVEALAVAIERGLRGPGRTVAAVALVVAAVGGALVVPRMLRSPPATTGHDAPPLLERRLTADPADPRPMGASLSPDGRSLATLHGGALKVRVLASGEERTLKLPDGLTLATVAWFPDNLHLLIGVWDGTTTSLQRLSSRGGPPEKIVVAIPGGAVSPDGGSVAYLRAYPDGSREVWLTGTDDHRSREVGAVPNARMEQELVWSPDGRALLVVDVDGTTPRLRILGMDGHLSPPIAEGRDLDGALSMASFAWLRDGRVVYLRHHGEDQSTLWMAHVDPVRPIADIRPALRASFVGHTDQILGADGSDELLTLRMVVAGDLGLLTLSDDGHAVGELRRLTHDDWLDVPSSFTADGAAVLFQSLRDGRWRRLRASVGSDQVSPESPSERDAVGARPTPEGDDLIWLESSQASGRRSWRLMRTLQGGTVRVLADLGTIDVEVVSSSLADNRRVALRCARVAHGSCIVRVAHTLTRVDPETGATQQLEYPMAGARSWDLSPDGEEIAWLTPDRLMAVAVSDGASRLDVPLDPGLVHQFLAYDGAGQRFIITGVRRAPEAYAIMALDRSGAASVLWEGHDEWLSAPVVSPDGRHIAVARDARSANLWLLSGL